MGHFFDIEVTPKMPVQPDIKPKRPKVLLSISMYGRTSSLPPRSLSPQSQPPPLRHFPTLASPTLPLLYHTIQSLSRPFRIFLQLFADFLLYFILFFFSFLFFYWLLLLLLGELPNFKTSYIYLETARMNKRDNLSAYGADAPPRGM